MKDEIKKYTEFYGGKEAIMNLLLNELEKGTFSDCDEEFQKCCYYYITNLQEENTKLKELCDKYEEEHNTEFKIWKDERYQLLDYKSINEKIINKISLYRMDDITMETNRILDDLLNTARGVDKE